MNKTYILLLTALLILPLAYSSSVVMNLTFDDQADPWKDYSSLNHQFTSTAAFADASKCKFNSCADFTAMSNDILTSLAKFTLASGFSSCFWVYPTDPNFENTHFYYAIGKDPGTLKQAAENQYGTAAHFDTSTGNVLDGPSDSSTSTPNSWNHYCLSYDKAAGVKVWRNGVLIREKAYTGTLNSTASEAIVIGAGMFGGAYTMRGYMDEFVAFDYAIDQNKVSSLYGSQKVGSVSSVDVYVKAIKYEIPYDYANKNKLVSGGRMPILITIANAGSENTGSFNYKVELGNTAVCSSTISLSGLSETTITCDWQTSVGFHQGFVRIDAVASDANKDNNVQRLYIPFMDRPWFHFSAGDIATLKQYCGNSQNKIPNSACTFAETFQSEDFSSAWTGIDVDPRAKKGRENAMGCMLNGYNGNEQCKRAMNHLNGWASRPLSTYDSVQSIHELGEVGITYDLMFPYLTKSDNERLTAQFEAICQHITNLKNTRPDLDPDIIRGDNGFGFGSGMATFCYAIIGADKNNPTLIQKEDQSYWGKNIPDSWMNREQSYLKAYKDDAFAQYQEGWLYKTYSQPHIVENLYFEKRFGLNDLGKYQNAMCAMGREAVTMLLDTNYNGASLRNDEPRKFRAIQRGDSNSYQHITDGNFIDWDILLYYGALCEDKDVKANMLWLRQKVNDLGEGGITYPSIYLWKAVADKASQISPEQNMPKVQFDNANDIFLVRSGFSYSKDTVFQVDGGEERGSGHSQAQGYYLYALGEPFLDYEQVPLDDDVRAETFKNGVSLQPDTQPKEGSTGYYSAKCGFAPLNQYYGMSDCPVSGTYPDFRNLPLKYGGDVEDYMGTSDSNLAGAFVWRPYKNADPVREYFVKFGDLVAKRTVVTGVTQGQGIYHNFINLYNEFTEKVTGNNFTFSRNGNNMATQVVYSDIPLTFSEDSNLNSCFAKTDCSGSNRGTSKYRRAYYHADGTEADFIISHHWYTNNYKPVSKTGGNDKGLVQAGNTIIFDTDNDGTTINGGWSTDGWALAYNDFEVAAFNATSITQDGVTRFSSDSRVSVNIKTDLSGIIVTLNTMERAKNIDTSKKVKVTIDVGSAAVGGVMHDGAIVQSTISGSKVSFEASSSQNSDTYQIIADDDTPVQLLSVETTSIAADSITITSRVNKPSIITLSWGYSSALGTDITSNSQVNTISGLKPLTQVYYQVKVCDISNQCVTSGIYSALTLDASNVLPEIVSMEARDVFSTGFRVNLALTAEADATLIVAETEDMASPKEYISPTMMRNHYFLVSGLSNGTKYYWKLFGKDSQGNSYSSDTKVIMTSSAQSFVPQLTGFDGMTTDISSISDWSTIQHLILEDTRYGRIEFEDRVNGQGIDMASIVKLNFASISVNTKEAPGMDAPATLFFYRLPFKSPVILVDGDVCPEDICSFLSYSGNVLAVRVSHFSEYSVKEGAPREIKASSSGSSARPRPVIESEPEENVVITKENEFSAPSQNEVTALVIKESIAPEKKGPNLFFPIIILLGLVIVVPHLGKRRIDPEQAELIGKLLSAPDRSKRSMMTKSAETPIVLDDMKACNLLDLARVVYSLSDAQYKQYANDIQMWIACSLYLPDVANIMQYASGREDVYRILYNLHQKENNPGYIPITRVPENIVSCDMHSSSYMLRLRNGQTVQSLNHLMTLLPFMSGEVFEAHVNKGVNEIALWAREQNDSMGSMLSEMKSKEQMHSFLKSIKCDQEMHRLLSSI